MSRNVALLCLDSVRKDFFDEFAPRLRERADVSFGQCRAASSWSTPSHASMFTGLLPHQHGVHTHNRDFRTVDPSRTFLDDLSGYRKLGVSANVFASSRFGFDAFFDRFVEVSTGCRFPDGLDPNRFAVESGRDGLGLYLDYLRDAVGHDHSLKSLLNGFLAYVNVASRDAPIPKLLDDGANVVVREAAKLVTAGEEPFFLFTNFGDAHVPLRSVLGYDRSLYDAPADWTTDEASIWDVVDAVEDHGEYLERRRGLYAAAIDYLDRKVTELVDALATRTDRETTVVVTADHGENLGYDADHGLINHKSSVSEGLLHVPLVVVNPPEGLADADGFVSHLALPDLLSGIAAGDAPDPCRPGVAAELVGLSPGPAPPEEYDRDHWDRMLRAAYDGSRKVTWDSAGAVTTYDLDLDRPCWQPSGDSADSVPAWATDRFDEPLGDYKKRARVDDREALGGEADEFTKQRLRDLGYL